MKSWEPDSEFERADFPRSKPSRPAASPPAKKSDPANAAAHAQKAGNGREVRAWRPRSVDEAAQGPIGPGKEAPVRAPASSVQGAGRSAGNAEPAARPGAAMSLLGQSIIENLESAAVALRSLYWDKKDQTIGGKRRIKAILTYAGPQALKALRSVLTPMEREQFAGASRTEKSCDSALAEQICRDFIARLRHI